MEPFYLLLLIAGLVSADLLHQLFRVLRGGLRGHPFERRWPFLSAIERRCLVALEQAAGGDCKVIAKTAMAALLVPEAGLGRRVTRLANAALRGRRLDFVVCSGADLHPLCGVRIASGSKRRARRRADTFIARACDAAGLPCLELPRQEGPYDVGLLRTRLQDAIETAGVSIAVEPEPPRVHDPDEEVLLAGLASTMREPDEVTGQAPVAARGRK